MHPSSQTAKRRGVGCAALALALAAAGPGVSAVPAAAAHPRAGTAAQHADAQAAKRKKPPRRVRAGCSQYCAQAGGYGAGPSNNRPALKVVTKTTKLTSDGSAIPVRLKCRFPKKCEGAILITGLDSSTGELGRSDLSLASGQTVIFEVPLTASGKQALASMNGSIKILVTADAGVTYKKSKRKQSKGWDFVVPRTVTLTR